MDAERSRAGSIISTNVGSNGELRDTQDDIRLVRYGFIEDFNRQPRLSLLESATETSDERVMVCLFAQYFYDLQSVPGSPEYTEDPDYRLSLDDMWEELEDSTFHSETTKVFRIDTLPCDRVDLSSYWIEKELMK